MKLPYPELLDRASRDRAFFVEVDHGYFHESDEKRNYVDVVFVLPSHVTIVHGVLEKSYSLPAGCGPRIGDLAIAAELVDRPGHAIGHFRVVRRDDAGTATLPAIPATRAPPCAGIERFRIEDHFVDLDAGAWLSGYAQSYDAPPFEPVTVPAAVPFDRFVVGADGTSVDVATEPCREASQYWN